MTVYVALRSLGIKVDVLPVVIDDEEGFEDIDEDEERQSLAVKTEESEREKAERRAKREAEKREAEKSPERSAEYLEYKHLARRVHVGAKLQPHLVADSDEVEEEEGGLRLLAVSTICYR